MEYSAAMEPFDPSGQFLGFDVAPDGSVEPSLSSLDQVFVTHMNFPYEAPPLTLNDTMDIYHDEPIGLTEPPIYSAKDAEDLEPDVTAENDMNREHTSTTPEGTTPQTHEKNKPRKRKPASEWAEKRDLIKSLYIDQAKSLPATMKILKEEHGFEASEKAFKEHLNEWKMFKNVKKRQASFMLKLEKQRKNEEGKETVFTYNGVQVPKSKLQRFSKTLSLKSDISSIPSFVSYFTPRGSKDLHFKPEEFAQYFKPEEFAQAQNIAQQQQNAQSAPLSSESPQDHVTPQDTWNDAVHPLSYTTVRPLLLTVMDALNAANLAVDRYNGILTNDIEDSMVATIDMALDAFLVSCQGQAEMSFAIDLLASSTVLSLVEADSRCNARQRDIVSMSVMYSLSKCLLTEGHYADAEIILERYFSVCQQVYHDNLERRFRKEMPSVMLSAKTYLAQGKSYILAVFLESRVAEARSLLDCEEGVTLQKLLLISSMVSTYRHDLGCTQFIVTEKIEGLLRNFLHYIKSSVHQTDFSLAILGYLQRKSGAPLSPDELKMVKHIFRRAANSGYHTCGLAFDAGQSLVRYYQNLQQYEVMTQWALDLEFYKESLERSSTYQEHARRYAEHDTLSQSEDDYPLRKAFSEFLWKDEPRIPLPWGGSRCDEQTA